MKPFLLLSAFVLATLGGRAQTKGTAMLYGYVQQVSKGKAPEISDGPQQSSGFGKNYFLYAASSTRIYPAEIWLNGERYGVGFSTIKATPVEWGNSRNVGSPKRVLVPKTTQQVLQLELKGQMEEKAIGKAAQSLAKTSAVVLVYKQGGKFYYTTLKKLDELERASLQ